MKYFNVFHIMIIYPDICGPNIYGYLSQNDPTSRRHVHFYVQILFFLNIYKQKNFYFINTISELIDMM